MANEMEKNMENEKETHDLTIQRSRTMKNQTEIQMDHCMCNMVAQLIGLLLLLCAVGGQREKSR